MKKYIATLGAIALLFPTLTYASFGTSLSYRSRGIAVANLQEFLISQNCLTATATGYFGSLTLAGVKCFQNKYGISSTGYFGTMSRAKANLILQIPTASNPSSAANPNLPAQGMQSSVNFYPSSTATSLLSPLVGTGTTTVNVDQNATSVYSLSPLVGSGVVPPASTSLSQGANAVAPLSPLIDNDTAAPVQ